MNFLNDTNRKALLILALISSGFIHTANASTEHSEEEGHGHEHEEEGHSESTHISPYYI